MDSQPERQYRVLFVCTGNCCRSQIAEALLRHMGGRRFIAASAGTNPAGYVHPLALEALKRLGASIDGQYSKSCADVAGEPYDLVITVCDYAACVPSPEWTGDPVRVHWSLPDPSYMPGTPEERIARAVDVAQTVQRWLSELIALPLDRLSRDETEKQLARIAAAH